jgi:hypothetical protein
MSIALNSTGQVEPITYTALTTTNATAVLTVSAFYQQRIEAILLCNVDTANTCYVTLSWNDGSSDFVFWTGTIAAGDTEIIEAAKLVMRTDGKVRVIKATAAAANDINVTVITSAISRQNG